MALERSGATSDTAVMRQTSKLLLLALLTLATWTRYGRLAPAQRRRVKILFACCGGAGALLIGAAGGVRGVCLMLAIFGSVLASMLATDVMIDERERLRLAVQRDSASERTTAS